VAVIVRNVGIKSFLNGKKYSDSHCSFHSDTDLVSGMDEALLRASAFSAGRTERAKRRGETYSGILIGINEDKLIPVVRTGD